MRGIFIALLVLYLTTGSYSIESRFANDVVEPTKLGEVDAAPAATPKAPSLKSFDSADANGDGCIDKAEFFAAKATSTAFSVSNPAEALKGLWSAFFNSLAMIIVTELGDKTFFIAAILAMQYSRMPVFTGAATALVIMTFLSVAIGFALPSLLPKAYTHYAATALFMYFGLRLLKDASEMEDGVSDELEEVEQELGATQSENSGDDVESATAPSIGPSDNGEAPAQYSSKSKLSKPLTYFGVISQAFTLTFLAEWGDRSQIATIAMAAARNPIGVSVGGSIGHMLCTGLAVVGGRMLATRISERTVHIAGGVLFCIFGLHALLAGA